MSNLGFGHMYKLFILGSLVWGSFLGSLSCSDQLFIRNHGLVVNFVHLVGSALHVLSDLVVISKR